ncbi:MAG: hypothetical protein WC636_03865 [Candidatus Margulisiibacteriota bacterium]
MGLTTTDKQTMIKSGENAYPLRTPFNVPRDHSSPTHSIPAKLSVLIEMVKTLLSEKGLLRGRTFAFVNSFGKEVSAGDEQLFAELLPNGKNSSLAEIELAATIIFGLHQELKNGTLSPDRTNAIRFDPKIMQRKWGRACHEEAVAAKPLKNAFTPNRQAPDSIPYLPSGYGAAPVVAVGNFTNTPNGIEYKDSWKVLDELGPELGIPRGIIAGARREQILLSEG